MSQIVFTILGSSAGMPQANRVSSGYVLAIDGRLFLFDCGGGVSAAFCRAGFDPLAIDSILISHTHPDHVSDLPLFIQMEYLAKRTEPLKVFLPSEFLAPWKEYMPVLYLIPEKFPFTIDAIGVEPGMMISCDRLRVKALLNRHLEPNREIVGRLGLPNRMQCFSYLIQAGQSTILYSADLGSESELLPYLRDLNLLVIESTHIDLSVLFQAAVENRVGRVVLTHIAQEFDEKQALLLAQKAGLDVATVASDGMQISL